MTKRTLHAVVAAAALLTLPALAPAQNHYTEMKSMKTIVQIASEAGNFSTLLTALKATGLAETLEGKGPFTVFAPSDSAFAKLPAGTVEGLLKNPEKLAAILTYHVVRGVVTAADILRSEGASPETINGQSLGIQLRGGKVLVNGAQVVATDIQASNGVIHVIDAVLIPAMAPAPAGR